MKCTKRPIEKRIHSAKSWLDKAEQSYADDADMKGELQLMLAQAELQRLKETEASSHRRRFLWMTTVGICLLIIGGAWTAKWLDSVYPPRTTVEIVPAVSVPADSPRESNQSKSQPAPPAVVRQATTTEAVAPEAVEERGASSEVTESPTAPVTTTAPPAAISTAQIKQAVREGERSLRGQ